MRQMHYPYRRENRNFGVTVLSGGLALLRCGPFFADIAFFEELLKRDRTSINARLRPISSGRLTGF